MVFFLRCLIFSIAIGNPLLFFQLFAQSSVVARTDTHFVQVTLFESAEIDSEEEDKFLLGQYDKRPSLALAAEQPSLVLLLLLHFDFGSPLLPFFCEHGSAFCPRDPPLA